MEGEEGWYSHEAPSAEVCFLLEWRNPAVRKEGKGLCSGFPCCEYPLKATQATDSSLKESFQGPALKEDLT